MRKRGQSKYSLGTRCFICTNVSKQNNFHTYIKIFELPSIPPLWRHAPQTVSNWSLMRIYAYFIKRNNPLITNFERVEKGIVFSVLCLKQWPCKHFALALFIHPFPLFNSCYLNFTFNFVLLDHSVCFLISFLQILASHQMLNNALLIFTQ